MIQMDEEENNSELEKDDATVDEYGEEEDEGTILHESNESEDDYEEENDQFCKLDPRNVVGAIGDGNPIKKTLADLHNILNDKVTKIHYQSVVNWTKKVREHGDVRKSHDKRGKQPCLSGEEQKLMVLDRVRMAYYSLITMCF